ncbi:MAG: cytidine deaminase [Actinomycetota bacterium]
MNELDPEQRKLVTLAMAARVRTGADQAAALRDTDGRCYAGVTVALPSLRLSALQVAVAMAVSSGALGVEAAVVLGDESADEAGAAAVRELAPSAVIQYIASSR